MKICFISDTHMMHHSITKHMPEADVLVHSGDFTSRGKDSEAIDFLEWFGKLQYKHKILIAGNHDFCCQKEPEWFKHLFNTLVDGGHYLDESCVVIDGIKFYGSPWTPWFCDWAFNLNECSELNKDLYEALGKPKSNYSSKECWDKIPLDTNVLVTHGPAFGILDDLEEGGNVGCEFLLDKMSELHKGLLVHACGHIHHSYSIKKIIKENLSYLAINSSICTEEYRPRNKPIIIEIS